MVDGMFRGGSVVEGIVGGGRPLLSDVSARAGGWSSGVKNGAGPGGDDE